MTRCRQQTKANIDKDGPLPALMTWMMLIQIVERFKRYFQSTCLLQRRLLPHTFVHCLWPSHELQDLRQAGCHSADRLPSLYRHHNVHTLDTFYFPYVWFQVSVFCHTLSKFCKDSRSQINVSGDSRQTQIAIWPSQM